jgi:uncharacterized coiled-coil DUF342 family protein
MSERISDERLVEIEKQLPPWRTQPRYAFAQELLPELRAERAKVRELEAEVARLKDELIGELYAGNLFKASAEAAEAKVARVLELPEKWRAEELSARTACPDDPSCMDGDDCANWLDQALQEPEQ